MSNDKEDFRILSIDGGGIKGLYSATILNTLETHYGGVISDYFDMICGTSTGGIIALALSIGRETEEIVEFYKKYGPHIFPNHSKISRIYHTLKQFLHSSKYSNKTLNLYLKEFFGEAKIKDANCCVCIPTVNLDSNSPVIIKTDHNEELKRDGERLMREVALATSAAPTYFPIARLSKISNNIVDGGIYANNPSFVGVFEALRYFVGNDKGFKNIKLLSISNISNIANWSVKKKKSASIWDWKRDLIPLIMNTQSNSLHNLITICKNDNLLKIKEYYRVSDPELNKKNSKIISLDHADKRAIETLENLGYSKGNEIRTIPEITSFFNRVN